MAFCLAIKGDYACFTRPEMKVERVSYDVITPSAARAIFESILWKPAIEWRINKIEVLSPIRWINIRRNELGSVIPVKKLNEAMSSGAWPAQYIEDERQQRAGLFLRDVHYRLHASFELTDKAGVDDNAAKFADMFLRRAQKGQCINQPYLGCREFACDFYLPDLGDTLPPTPIVDDRELGWMLYDLDYEHSRPRFFNARMQQGVIQVPNKSSVEIRG